MKSHILLSVLLLALLLVAPCAGKRKRSKAERKAEAGGAESASGVAAAGAGAAATPSAASAKQAEEFASQIKIDPDDPKNLALLSKLVSNPRYQELIEEIKGGKVDYTDPDVRDMLMEFKDLFPDSIRLALEAQLNAIGNTPEARRKDAERKARQASAS